MKTTVEKVAVVVRENGQTRRRFVTIMTKDGELMTHRLKRVMRGNIPTRHSNGPDEETHFVGMLWEPPYKLLKELRDERCALTNQLMRLDGHDRIRIAEPPLVPKKASHDAITRMVSEELKLYYDVKRKIRAHEQKT